MTKARLDHVHYSLYLPTAQYRQLRAEAGRQGTTVADFLRALVASATTPAPKPPEPGESSQQREPEQQGQRHCAYCNYLFSDHELARSPRFCPACGKTPLKLLYFPPEPSPLLPPSSSSLHDSPAPRGALPPSSSPSFLRPSLEQLVAGRRIIMPVDIARYDSESRRPGAAVAALRNHDYTEMTDADGELTGDWGPTI